MVICPVCKTKGRLLESRKLPIEVTVAGKEYESHKMLRRRECTNCRRRWQTEEVLISGTERGFGHV